MKKDGGPALLGVELQGGVFRITSQLSLRDYFAAAALTGLSAYPGGLKEGSGPKAHATVAYDYADAMLAKRDK